jgi:hypothetical protein
MSWIYVPIFYYDTSIFCSGGTILAWVENNEDSLE